MSSKNKYGVRSGQEDTRRYIFLLFILLMVIIINLKVSSFLIEKNNAEFINSENWAYAYYKTPDTVISVPGKTENTKRIIYISNSHAMTGGRITRHLQQLLQLIEPGTFEVYDMSDLGVFAPDILQRVISSINFKPDLIILGVSYLTLADNMNLPLQAHSVRSFFKSGIFNKLSWGFWLRNYDLNVYADTYVSDKLLIYKYRNFIHNIWENWVAGKLKFIFGDEKILFLEIEQNVDWKSPENFGQNLFEWDIYAHGRKYHLSDFKDAVTITKKSNIPVLAFNIPIHWDKSVTSHRQNDFELYQMEIKDIFHDVMEYIDYQAWFPKEFTTYDSLHPTWYGARLHALDICLRLNKYNYFNNKTRPETIVDIYMKMQPAVDEEYISSLDGIIPSHKKQEFIGKDIFEPDNARALLSHIASYPIGSTYEINLLFELSLMINYWLNMEPLLTSDLNLLDPQFVIAVSNELDKAVLRTNFFKEKLIELQHKRLVKYPIPNWEDAIKLDLKNDIKDENLLKSNSEFYMMRDNTVIQVDSDSTGRIISFTVRNSPRSENYRRIDLLGDGSFILIQEDSEMSVTPPWLMENILPFSQFAVKK